MGGTEDGVEDAAAPRRYAYSPRKAAIEEAKGEHARPQQRHQLARDAALVAPCRGALLEICVVVTGFVFASAPATLHQHQRPHLPGWRRTAPPSQS